MRKPQEPMPQEPMPQEPMLEELMFAEGADVPNNPQLPVLVYRQAVSREEEAMARVFEERFTTNGWGGIWRNGIFRYHHFHPDAHEALGVVRGSVEVRLGGEEGQTLSLEAGDLVVLPAGTGHKNLGDSGDLLVVGAYPAGQENFTTSRLKTPGEKVGAVPLPKSDPFHGVVGPLTRRWR
jgi:uncharacterized protein YjlB